MSLLATRLSKLAAVFFVLAQLAVVSQAQTKEITRCGTEIKLPGTYVLANDLLNCPADGIDITFGHVTLELGNHQITGMGTGTGIYVDRHSPYVVLNVVIHGPATISNFDKGLELVDSQDGVVSGVTCTGNNTGFVFQRLHDSWNNAIKNNVATLNHGVGFEINGDWSHYEYNQSNQNGGSGFALTSNDGEDNFVNNNVANDNGRDGIEAEAGALHNMIYENHATGNSEFDLSDDNSGGCQNTWLRNGFNTSNKNCIH